MKFDKMCKEYLTEDTDSELEEVKKKVSKAMSAPHLGVITQKVELNRNNYYIVDLHKDVKQFYAGQLKKLLKAFPNVTIRKYSNGDFFLEIKK